MDGEGRVGAGSRATITLVIYRKQNVLEAKQPPRMRASLWDSQPEKPENICAAEVR